ncbi:MAG: glycosyltransferase family 4 protein [Methanomicrobiales archaeon]|nr:glycosyltransferase family 4 protein [Methanomicrobiales archaeon]
MRICMLTTTHRPRDGRIFEKEAKSLAKEHDVTVIAPSDAGDTGEEGVRIITVPKPASPLLHGVTLWRVLRACRGEECDVIHCHEPDALLLARFVDAKIAVSESVAGRFRGGRAEPVIISNYSVAGLAPPDPGVRERYGVVYMAGNMQMFHGVRECIQAISRVRVKFPYVSLTLIGGIRADIGAIMAKTNPRPEITMTGYLPYREMYEALRAGSVGLLVFQPAYHNAYIGLPNKLFDYMLCGLPVVASDFPEIRKVVTDAGCGILVDPTSPDAIAEAVIYLMEHPEEAQRMGESGQRAVLERYNWGRMEERLLDLYQSLNDSGMA